MFPATSQVKLLIAQLNITLTAVLSTKYAETRTLLYCLLNLHVALPRGGGGGGGGGAGRGGGGGGEGRGAGVVRGGRGGKVLCCMACAWVCWLLGREWFLSSNS